MARTLLIDGDVLVYRYAHSSQTVICWERDLYTTHAWLSSATDALTRYFDGLMEKLNADELFVALSDLDCYWRREVFPAYKANRAGNIRPILFKPLRDHFTEEYGALVLPRLEGDDVLGISHTGALEGETVIVTIDKDLYQVPGLVYNIDSEKLTFVSYDEAWRFHLTQTLTGDRTDGYPGCPGVGPVNAKKILDACEHPGEGWTAVVKAYEKKKLNEEYALTQARCAYVLRHDDWDYYENDFALWRP